MHDHLQCNKRGKIPLQDASLENINKVCYRNLRQNKVNLFSMKRIKLQLLYYFFSRINLFLWIEAPIM